jgi:glycerol-3-phosphate cytidylyltransferase
VKLNRVITYGTYDILHGGHINLLRQAKAMGDHLTVGLSSDPFNKIKKKVSYNPFAARRTVLEAIRYVDRVIIEETWEQKMEDVIKYEIDVLVMGDDWLGKFDFLKTVCEVVYLPRTKGVSSSQIKAGLL